MGMAATDWYAVPPAAEGRDDACRPEKSSSQPPKSAENLVLSEVEEHDAQAQVMPGVTTGALVDAMADPRVFEEVARGDLYVQLARMRRQAPHYTPTQQLDYTKLLAKIGKVDTPAGDDANPLARMPMITIQMAGGAQVSLGAAPEKDVTPVKETHDG